MANGQRKKPFRRRPYRYTTALNFEERAAIEALAEAEMMDVSTLVRCRLLREAQMRGLFRLPAELRIVQAD
jgi:hypothetical protein